MQSIKNSLAGFWKYRYLLQNLITRDFKLKYRRSVLGVAWSILNPLLTCLVMFLVFDSIMRGLRGEGIPNFAGFLIIGQLLFNFFRESTSMAMESVLKNAPLLRKVCFAMVNCAFSFIALVIVFVITWTPVTFATAWMALYPLIMLFFFSLGIGLLLSALYVFVRDIMHIWEVFCTLLVYASAIFYDPETLSGIMQKLIHINPMYWFITAFRSCVLWGEGLTLSMVVVCFLCAAVSMTVGVIVFKKNQDKFVLYM